MNFLPLLHEGVVLRDPLESELLHQVNLVGFPQMLLHKLLHAERERGREQ